MILCLWTHKHSVVSRAVLYQINIFYNGEFNRVISVLLHRQLSRTTLQWRMKHNLENIQTSALAQAQFDHKSKADYENIILPLRQTQDLSIYIYVQPSVITF